MERTFEDVGNVSHILVDGSNLIHAWPELRGLLKRDKGQARERLIARLLVLLPEACERLTVVFDGRGGELVVEHPHGPRSVAVLYTPSGVTADDVIEQLVGRASDPSGCLVATGDQAERSTIEAAGAVWCSVGELAARVERAGERQGVRVENINRRNRRDWKNG